MLLTNNRNLAARARHLSTQAIKEPINYVHDDVGYNYRLTNLQAAVGCAQLEKIKFYLKRKKDIYQNYKNLLKNFFQVNFANVPEYSNNNKWMMSVILKNTNNNKNKRNLINFLKKNKIQSRSIWKPNHLQKPFLKYERFHIKKANKVFENTINIPCSTNLSIKETKKVVKIIRKFYSKTK